MKKRLITILCLHLSIAVKANTYVNWDSFKSPSPQISQAVGSYSNGCLLGAQPLKIDGEGYQVMRLSRNRYYGHPTLISYLEDLAKKTKALGMNDLLYGDISMPRGGPFKSGHASHQMGLDADIWLKFAAKKYTKKERENISAVTLVDMTKLKPMEKNWTKDHYKLLELAASDKRVARIFTHPVIKRKLCEASWINRSFLQKIRPWYGHNYHFHVRLSCPKDSQNCIDQAPIGKGDGCHEVAGWIHDMKNPKKTTGSSVKTKKVLPDLCRTNYDLWNNMKF